MRSAAAASMFVMCFAAVILMFGTPLAVAAPDDWAEGSAEHGDGATRVYYNQAGRLLWRNREKGDWRDAAGVQQGDKPYATLKYTQAKEQPLELDVTPLVNEWLTGKSRHKGFFLRSMDSANLRLHSREAENAAARPKLLLAIGGKQLTLEATADTYIAVSTTKPQGNSKNLTLSGATPVLIRFDLSGLKPTDKVTHAVLRLVSPQQFGTGTIGVFACDQGGTLEQPEPLLGLAAKYKLDQGIEKDPDVVFATGFDSSAWKDEWSYVRGRVESVGQNPTTNFEPLLDKALQVEIGKGEVGAGNIHYKFARETGSEPEEIYFRYYLRLGSDWNQTVQGGKMPGFGGTYGRAGNGGAKVDGKNGWSARGAYFVTVPEGNPLAGKHPLGWYVYHADMEGFFGSHWSWGIECRGLLDNDRWYCIDQYIKLNTPAKTEGEKGANDGILRAWVDGRLAGERTNVRFRDVDTLKLEQVWVNIYHGGRLPSPYDQHMYMDNVVIARKYIGPMGGR